MEKGRESGTSSAAYPTWSIRSEQGTLRSERPRRKGEGMASSSFLRSHRSSYAMYFMFYK